MASKETTPTAASPRMEAGNGNASHVALASTVPTRPVTLPGGSHGPRNDHSRGSSETPSQGRDADATTAQDSPTPAPSKRTVDPMRSRQPPAAAGSAPDKTNAEDGSAEALLSLMESVRAKEIKFVQGDSLLLSTASGKPPSAPPAITVPLGNSHDGSSSGERAGDASSDGGGEETPRTRPQKKRKSTHTVRKEEKAMLMTEIRALEDRLSFLRGQVFAPVRDGTGQIVDPGVSNAVLRQAIHEQQLRFASARSLLSQSLTSAIAAPLHTYLHLGSDMAERRAQLLAIKATSLAEGKQYIEERSRLLDLTKHHAVVERFETLSGDACCLRFYVDQFPSKLTSVKNVHDATSFFTSNLEMSITECLGHITIREDDDSGDPSLAQHRLVVAGTHGVVVDTNTVVFSHYNEQENYGLLTTTYVDEDELHPYRPLERIRQDVTAVSLITQQDDIVVVRRWAYVCMRHSPHIVFPYGVLQAIRENLGVWGDGMMQLVREQLRSMKVQQARAAAAAPAM